MMKLSLLTKVILFGFLTVLSLVSILGICTYSNSQVRIGGPIYSDIKLSADLLADILPPPMYVVEAYLEATLALQNPGSTAAHKKRIDELRRDFDDRQKFWSTSELRGDLKNRLTVDSQAEAQKFWTIVDHELMPALEKSDMARARESYASLGSVYAAHRAIIDDLVAKAQVSNKQLEDAAEQRIAMFALLTWTICGIGAAVIGLSIASNIFGTVRPVVRLTDAVAAIAAGNLGTSIPGLDRSDEIGKLAGAVGLVQINAEQKARDELERTAQQEAAAAEQRKAELRRLAATFETSVGNIVQAVSSASTELESSANTLASTASHSEQLATMVASGSEEASVNVQAVASATEQLSSSVNEISRQVQESARIAGNAVDQAHATTQRVGELSVAATRIGDVVELINTIAGQTNLLALNATIEAARAGDAGRGFAVVASEVKALAEQTAKATDEISQQISSVQMATQESVTAIKEISATIAKLSEVSSAIASAVEEQGAATVEISRNVQQASHGTQQVSANILDVKRGATDTGSASSNLLSTARTLATDSTRLKSEVSRFLDTVRAA
jgi:methyl-accepting chemotaxis protein